MRNKPIHMLREVWSKFKEKTSTKLEHKKKWVHPKDRIERWKIIKGDMVKVIAGDDKHKIGKVQQVDKLTNRVWVENVKMGRMTKSLELQMDEEPQNKDKTGGWWMKSTLKSIHVSNVMHVHPDDLKNDLIPAKEKRRVRVDWKKINLDGKDIIRWRRVICGTDTIIPFPPKPKEPGYEQNNFEDASQLTWKISKESPLPKGSFNYEQAGVQESFNTVCQASFFTAINLVVDFSDTSVPAKVGESVDRLLKSHFHIFSFKKFGKFFLRSFIELGFRGEVVGHFVIGTYHKCARLNGGVSGDLGLYLTEMSDNSLLQFFPNYLKFGEQQVTDTLQTSFFAPTIFEDQSSDAFTNMVTGNGLGTPAPTQKLETIRVDENQYSSMREASHTNADSAVVRYFSTPVVTERLQLENKPGSIVRPRRKTMNLGKKLGPPQRVKINNESLFMEEKGELSIVLESDRLQISDSKEQALPLKDEEDGIAKMKKIVSFDVESSKPLKQSSKEKSQDDGSQSPSSLHKKFTKKEFPAVAGEIIHEDDSRSKRSHPDNIHHVNTAWLNGKPYTIMERIGRGGSSKVYRVRDSNGQDFALKKVSFKGVDQNAISGYINEIELLQKLAGRDSIIKLYDSEINHDRGYLLMLMECGDIDLAHLLNNQSGKSINIEFIRSYWRQMLEAVYTIHLEKIVHSDLKPANFIVIAGTLKLIDFGIAKTIPNDTTNIHREQQVGTINYMSPEAILDTNLNSSGRKLMKLGRASDVWSLGCILYQMVYGCPPFSHLSLVQKIKCITDSSYQIEFPETISLIPKSNKSNPEDISQESDVTQTISVDENLLRIMKSCLQRNPKERMTIPALLTDPFFGELQVPVSPPILDNLIREMIKYAKTADITHQSHEQIKKIKETIFSQLRNKEPINCEQWNN
ncbi:15977_t:CDS:10 [Acaulospora morrowiae]|uniref:15977_t:CDS:1 n=1 Tax=Acaulospora morrowiae TaxID=94023 RepID=A0A9N9DLN7_9GLOM|nr:15977_t:CDS:10 [Acaulospora morrowiae]